MSAEDVRAEEVNTVSLVMSLSSNSEMMDLLLYALARESSNGDDAIAVDVAADGGLFFFLPFFVVFVVTLPSLHCLCLDARLKTEGSLGRAAIILLDNVVVGSNFMIFL